MPRIAALLAMLALFSATAMPALADPFWWFQLTANADGSVDLKIPAYGGPPPPLIKFSPLGMQTVSYTPAPFDGFNYIPTVVHDPTPGAWACYVWTAGYPALCVVPNSHTPTGVASPISFYGGNAGNEAMGGNNVIITWDTNPPGADTSLVVRMDGNYSILPTSTHGYTAPVTGTTCYVVGWFHQGQFQGASDIMCVVPNTWAGNANGAARAITQAAPRMLGR